MHDWVKNGGALLLIADHAPFGGAAAALASRFGVDMSKGYTFDPENAVAGSPTQLIFSRDNKLLGNHPILEGRNENERIKLLRSFTGQSLKGPEGSTGILNLANTATDRPTFAAETSVSAAGRAQAVAFKFGKGRVLVQGEAAMLSAQSLGSAKPPDGHECAWQRRQAVRAQPDALVIRNTEVVVWDKKRQLIWIVGGVLMGTFVAYSNSFDDDDGKFVLSFFIFMESLILLIMAGLFYLYSRR